jgi:hypothetical protein
MQLKTKLLSQWTLPAVVLLLVGLIISVEGTCASHDNNDSSNSATISSVTCQDSASTNNNNNNNNSIESNSVNQHINNTNKVPSDCQDKTSQCEYWAEVGECKDNPTYMSSRCPRSCQSCPDQLEEILMYGIDLGERQLLTSSVFTDVTQQDSTDRIVAARDYVTNLKLHQDIMELCVNKDESCTIWAMAGECDKNPMYSKYKTQTTCL